jgi:hypothetical protein
MYDAARQLKCFQSHPKVNFTADKANAFIIDYCKTGGKQIGRFCIHSPRLVKSVGYVRQMFNIVFSRAVSTGWISLRTKAISN